MRISAAGDEMVEECDVATFGDFVEEDQGLVERPEADPWAVVLVLVVSPVDVDTLVKQPVDRLSGVGVIPRMMLAMQYLHSLLIRDYELQNPMPSSRDVAAEFHKEFDQFN
jgi:hypothetical protein